MFNVYNSLAAVGCGVLLGLTKPQIEQGIMALESVEGRMTSINEGQNFSVIVDYAHTPDSFEKLFELSEEIPNWLISYKNRSYPGVEEFEKLIAKFRDVKVEAKTYHNGRGGKGSVAGSQEILFVCKPKKKHIVSINQQQELVNERL